MTPNETAGLLIRSAFARRIFAAALAGCLGLGTSAQAVGPAPFRISVWPKHYAEAHQTNGCFLTGRAFGQIFVGGGVIANGVRYRIDNVRVGKSTVTYTGPGVTATFTPVRGRLVESVDGAPIGSPKGPVGVVRIRIGSHAVDLPAREACAIYE